MKVSHQSLRSLLAVVALLALAGGPVFAQGGAVTTSLTGAVVDRPAECCRARTSP